MSFHKKLRQKIFTTESLPSFLNSCRQQQQKIVFTNGCFDILHQGHVEYLCHAKDLGDILIVGLNTDDSVKRLGKAPDRPINGETTRAVILAALACVDAVVIFNEDTPYELISFIQPDVLVKGSDYQPKDIVGYDIVTGKGGQVMTIPLVNGFSTTQLIEKMKS